MRSHQIKMKDSRVQMFCLCFASNVYTIFHYGIFNPKYKAHFFFIIEFLRFFIMYWICYYYLDKASKLLSNGKSIIKFLQIWGVISTLGYMVLGVIMSRSYFVAEKINMGYLCTKWYFEVNRLFPITICFIFFAIYC